MGTLANIEIFQNDKNVVTLSPSIMLETDRLPATFKIISEVPALQIKYCPYTHCGAIVLLPLPVLGFLYCSFLLLSTISSILAALYHGDWQIIEIYTHDIFEYIGVWLNFTFATCLFSFLVFGVTEFRACRKFRLYRTWCAS
jgi:hypothetical protein